MAPMAQWGGTSRGEGGPPARPITLRDCPQRSAPHNYVITYVSCYVTTRQTTHSTHTHKYKSAKNKTYGYDDDSLTPLKRRLANTQSAFRESVRRASIASKGPGPGARSKDQAPHPAAPARKTSAV